MWVKKKRKNVAKNRHHRLPRSLQGDNSRENISIVSIVKHRAYHALFSNGTPYDIANILNKLWIPKDYELVVRRRNEQNISSGV